MSRATTLLASLCLLAACGEKDAPVDSNPDPVVTDEDGDGYDGVDHGGDDCDDASPSVHPGADEVCDGIDNNCDGTIDTDAIDLNTYYQDSDGDGHGSADSTTEACEAPSGYVESSDDCDDAEASAYPGNDEICDGVDNNCNGDADELGAVDAPSWYPDNDGDGYGDPDYGYESCESPGGVYVAQGDDCDDARDYVNPGQPEVCDGVDNNCDGDVDGADAEGAPTWYLDGDADGYGDPNTSETSCEASSGYIEDSTDCDDSDRAIHPDADEVCDGVDNDCDGDTDEDDATDAATWYADADGDSYGDPSTTDVACDAPSGYVADNTDCDDAAASSYPGAPEYCDGVDTDCDGTLDDDDSIDASTWYADTDADGYGDATNTYAACSVPSGYTSDDTDCDDSAATTYPGADEVCEDSVDNDCDGTLDECAPEGILSLDDAYATFYGEFSNDRAGQEVADAGDINGDGFPDLLVAAPYSDAAQSNGGSVYLVNGPVTAGAHNLADADHLISMDEGSGNFGLAMAGIGDVDGDGNDDFIIGAEGYDLVDEQPTYSGQTNSGSAWIFLGPVTSDSSVNLYSYDSSTWSLYGYGYDARFGASVTALGDMNGDGIDDFAVGAPGGDDSLGYDEGVAYVFYGPVTGFSAHTLFGYAPDAAVLYGEASDDEAGTALASGDFNGDGTPDLLTGARYYGNDVGRAYLNYGPLSGTYALGSADTIFIGQAASDATGHGLGAGDLDGDGYDDALIGAPYADGNGADSGVIYLVYGAASSNASVSLSAADATYAGGGNNDQLGFTMDASKDYDGDGNLDLLVGSSANDGAASNAGAGYLMYGPSSTGALSVSGFDAIFQGGAAQDRAGWTVSGLTDHDGDGYDDIFIGAPYEDTNASAAGAAYLWLGDVR